MGVNQSQDQINKYNKQIKDLSGQLESMVNVSDNHMFDNNLDW